MPQDMSAGAVSRPSNPTLLEKLAVLQRAYPVSVRHLEAFRRLGSEYIYADVKNHARLGRIGVALLRLSDTLERMYGFTRELLVIYTPHADLQVRTYAAVADVINATPRKITSDLAFLWAQDDRLQQKLDDWSTTRLTVLPLPTLPDSLKNASEVIVDVLSYRIFRRDLFAETTPVSGDRFFGRRRLLQALAQDLTQGASPGLFGMRKTGKTSVVRRLNETMSIDMGDALIFIIRDLESLPLPTNNPIPDLLSDLVGDLLDQLRARGLRTYELVNLPDNPPIADFRRALQTIIRRTESAGIHFILALDEIEYLCPPELTSQFIPPAQTIPQFLGALRSIHQESSRFTFMLSGLSNAAIEAPTLYGRTNPIFSWAKSYYLEPFSAEESSELVTSLALRMGSRWDDGALDEVHLRSGGHAFLLRNLSSRVMKNLPVDPSRRLVYRSAVEDAARGWWRDVAGITAAMLDDFRRHYPDEMALLDVLAEDEAGFQVLARSEDAALGRLLRLGLVDSVTAAEFEPSSLYRALHGETA